jgi:anthranilate synthase component 1
LTHPTQSEFLRLTAEHPRVPLVRRFLSDHLTPIQLHHRILETGEDCFLLESGDGPEHATRYSFLGLGEGEPFGVGADGACFPDPDDHPFARLRRRIARSHPAFDIGPFPGGAIGYLAYEAATLFEDIPVAGPMPCPLMQFVDVDRFFVFDHLGRKLDAVVSVDVGDDADEASRAAAYEAAVARLDELEELVRTVGRPDLRPDPWFPEVPEPAAADSPYPGPEFLEGVETLKEHIRAGDIFQGVLSRRYEIADGCAEPFELYRVMRATNPSPYMFHLKMGPTQVLGTSPEALVTVRGGVASVRPIAGTRPRGKDRDEDLALEVELDGDIKENAEHVMLVDDRDALDALEATFPAGTVSGAPKIRAMQLLAGLEPEARGVYAGAIVYVGDGGELDSCIAIRTVVSYQPGQASIQAGAGIVYDSVAQSELDETRHKASAALRAAASPRE